MVVDIAISAKANLLISAGRESVKLWNLKELTDLARK
jgi:hypothetical protein